MPATFTELLPETKSSKHNSIRWTPADSGPGGFLEIVTGKKLATYLVAEFGTSWEGRAFHLAKVEGGTDPDNTDYDVFVPTNRQDFQCSCAGFAYGNGKRCKHIMACESILDNGWMRTDLVNPEQDVANTEPPL